MRQVHGGPYCSQGFWCDRYMTPADLLNSLVAVYPPEGSNIERSGALRGDRRVQSPQLPDTIKVHVLIPFIPMLSSA